MKLQVLAVTFGSLLVCSSAASAQEWGPIIDLSMSGFAEVPSISSAGQGRFLARGSTDGTRIQWLLTYEGLTGTPTQAHIHFGAADVNGGVAIFLCTNLGNGPAGTQACPTTATLQAPVTGISLAADVIGPAGQGIAPGELNEVIAAVLAGKAYVNIHSSTYAGGELRVQLPRGNPQ